MKLVKITENKFFGDDNIKILGIICEYNPFHNGHKLHIEKAKKLTNADFVICVMSGNFVQRGEPAIINKWDRAKTALINGVDVIIELPVYYATASAYDFSFSAVKLLNDLNIVDYICFGSETVDLDGLSKISDLLAFETDEYKKELKNNLDLGISFPVARNLTLEKLGFDCEALKNSNSILAIEYLKALKILRSNIKPFVIKREVSTYNDKNLTGNISSATSIRNALFLGNFPNIKNTMPKQMIDLVDPKKCVCFDDFSQALNYKIVATPTDLIENILDVDEGLENKIKKSVEKNCTVTDVIKDLKSKRYTYTKIQRMLIHILLDIKKDEFKYFNEKGYCQYVRVLGFRKENQFLLKLIKEKASVPLITNLKYYKNLSVDCQKMIEKEITTSNIYFSAQHFKNDFSFASEFNVPLVIV